MKSKIKPGDSVFRNDNLKPVRHSGRNFIPGVSGSVGGCAASHMYLGYPYRVKEVRGDGSLILDGFTLPVSPKHVHKA